MNFFTVELGSHQQLSFAPGPIELCSGNKVELCSLLDFYFIFDTVELCSWSYRA